MRSWLLSASAAQCRTFTYVPGAASRIGSGPSPTARALTSPPPRSFILFAINRKGHRRCVEAAARVELPKFLQRLGVKRHHFAGWLTGEDEVGSREDAAQIGERRFHFAGDLAG